MYLLMLQGKLINGVMGLKLTQIHWLFIVIFSTLNTSDQTLHRNSVCLCMHTPTYDVKALSLS